MTARSMLLLVLFLFVAACATPASTTRQDATPAASTGTASAAPAEIVLRPAPENLGCDSIGIDYGSLTFQIDPAAAEQVSALTNTGVVLRTYWEAGFHPGTGTERVIIDPAGQIAVTDGDVLQVGEPLGGYHVCLGPETIHVLFTQPS